MSKTNQPAPKKDGANDGAESAIASLGGVRFLKIAAKQEGGRHRAGRHWPEEDTEVPADEFTEEQLEQLLGDKKLVVVGFLKSPGGETDAASATDS